MKILITGGLDIVGAPLVKLLREREHELRTEQALRVERYAIL